MRKRFVSLFLAALLVTSSAALYMARPVRAADTVPAGDFSLQVTPSPLVSTIEPGQKSDLELQIRNAGTSAEDLKIEARAFTFDDSTGQVALKDTTPPDIAKWLSFSNPTFSIAPGAWFSEKLHVDLPKDSGFSYSFALVISRKNNPAPVKGSRILQGSLAVFTLVNVDRPGATSKLKVVSFTADKHVYEYLPSQLSVRFNNSGNTIVQPYGNIFVQRGSNGSALSTLKVNENKGYILPGTSRTLTTSWTEGFPAYKTTTDANGKTKKQLTWNWTKAADFRIGKYTAKLVAVYSDGQHDVPIEGEVSFWVIPWKILIALFVVSLLVLAGLWSLVRKIISLFKRKKRGPATPKEAKEPKEPTPDSKV